MDSDPASTPQVDLDQESFAQLNHPDAASLLDTIDSLRELGVGSLVNLPQIIVVGDQSSGKSSVLEAISGVRFPIDGDLCTRFATELVIRRADEIEVNVSIQFDGPSAAQSDASRQPFQRTTFDKDALPAIIRDAKELMGIRSGGDKRFSKDILRVEVAAPGVHPLTLVDLPGIFPSATAEQNLEDKETVDQLIASYMEQSKSIILAVVAANHQLAIQAVLERAKTHDEAKERTIGVITKPDLAGRGSANEKKYLDLVKGRESAHNLALGWYVLRNRAEDERSTKSQVRDEVEERFFRMSEWSAVSPANRGIESLRKRLSKVLLDHIKKNLPDLIRDIEERLRTRQQDLDRLGKPRSRPEELRSYLLGIAEDFQRLARDAVEGRYSEDFFGGVDKEETVMIKLRAVLRNLNGTFETVMETNGARYRIEDDSEAVKDFDQDNRGTHEYLQQLISQYDVPEPELKPRTELNAELQSLASFNRGKEFPGDTNAELAFLLFKKQAAPWQDIAQKHVEFVLNVTNAFVDRVFKHVVGADKATLDAILRCCVDPFFAEKKAKLDEKLQELLRPYTSGYALPHDEEFRAGMYRKTLQRLAGPVAASLERQHPELFQPNSKGLTRQKVMNALRDSARSERSRLDIDSVIDRMVLYYEMSRRTFVENVINLAVESCLVYDIPAILTPRIVDGMTADKLRELAAESEDVQRQRLDFQEEVRILREGLRKCQKHKSREVTVLSSALSRLSVGPGFRQTPSRTVSPEPSVPTPESDSTPPPAEGLTTTSRVVPPAPAATAATAATAAPTAPVPSVAPVAPAIPAASHETEASGTSVPGKTNTFPSLFGAPAQAPAKQSSGLFGVPAPKAQTSTNTSNGSGLFGGAFAANSGVGVGSSNPVSKPQGGGLFNTVPPPASGTPPGPPANPGGSLFRPYNTTSSCGAPSIFAPESTTSFASALKDNNNKNSNNDRKPFARNPGSVVIEVLAYPGIEAVPVLRHAPYHRHRILQDACEGEVKLCHVSGVERYLGYSPVEMRLRWMLFEEGLGLGSCVS